MLSRLSRRMIPIVPYSSTPYGDDFGLHGNEQYLYRYVHESITYKKSILMLV